MNSEQKTNIEEVYVQSETGCEDWSNFIKEEDEADLGMSDDDAGRSEEVSTHFLISDSSAADEEKSFLKPRPRRCYLCPDINTQGAHVFRFPTDAKRRAAWAQVCNIDPYKIKSSLRICEKHFRRHDLISGLTRTSLSRSAVPSVPTSNFGKRGGGKGTINVKTATTANSVNSNPVPCLDLKSRLLPIKNQNLNVNNSKTSSAVIADKETSFNAIPQATTTNRRIICGNSIRSLGSVNNSKNDKVMLTGEHLQNLLNQDNGNQSCSSADDKDDIELLDEDSENSDDLDEEDICSIDDDLDLDKSLELNRTTYRFTGDIASKNLVSLDKAKQCLEVAKKVITKKNKQIRVLQKKNEKMAKKIDHLESVLIEILEKRL